jgi:Fe-S cluster biogenesis protein NfuA
LREAVDRVLVDLRPLVQADGADLRLVDLDEATGVVRLSLVGSCAACPGHSSSGSASGAPSTGVARILADRVPAVRSVEWVPACDETTQEMCGTAVTL